MVILVKIYRIDRSLDRLVAKEYVQCWSNVQHLTSEHTQVRSDQSQIH